MTPPNATRTTKKAGDSREKERREMVRQIAAEVRETTSWTGKSALAPAVMAALAKVPRHEFVPLWAERAAYANSPLPIGHGQTISQPYIVALMTDLAQPDENTVALEVGTGCGYQAAVLAQVVRKVYSIEIVGELAAQARERLERLHCTNVEVRNGDGYQGWAEHAPFDAVIVTAAAPEIPPPLIEQLKPGGRMVIPVGSGLFSQDLILVEKDERGRLDKRSVVPVAFVPLTGKSQDPGFDSET